MPTPFLIYFDNDLQDCVTATAVSMQMIFCCIMLQQSSSTTMAQTQLFEGLRGITEVQTTLGIEKTKGRKKVAQSHTADQDHLNKEKT